MDAYSAFAPRFFDDVVPSPLGPALDVGCGEGRTTRELRARGHAAVGVDISPRLIRASRDADPTGNYLCVNASLLPFPPATFDIVVAYNTLMSVADLRTVAFEIARVLRAGGHACICITHPMADAGRFSSLEPDAPYVIDGSYLSERPFTQTWERDGVRMTFQGWWRSLEAYARAFADAGLTITMLREPAAPDDPDDPTSGLWQRIPNFLFLRLAKAKEVQPATPKR